MGLVGLVALEQTPRSAGGGCYREPPATSVTICLTADGLTSFASRDTTLQGAVVKQVAGKYGVYFSTQQLARLSALPFLESRLDQLPSILSAPAPMVSGKPDKNNNLGAAQVVACAQTARLLSYSLTKQPPSFLLVIDAKTGAAEVMHLFDLLEAKGINRFYLITHTQ